MPPNRFESEVESFLEGSHGDRTHIKRADHHTVTPLCGTLLVRQIVIRGHENFLHDEVVAGSRESVARLCCCVSTSRIVLPITRVVGCGHDDG